MNTLWILSSSELDLFRSFYSSKEHRVSTSPLKNTSFWSSCLDLPPCLACPSERLVNGLPPSRSWSSPSSISLRIPIKGCFYHIPFFFRKTLTDPFPFSFFYFLLKWGLIFLFPQLLIRVCTLATLFLKALQNTDKINLWAQTSEYLDCFLLYLK